MIGVHDAGGTGEVTQGVVQQLDGPGADHAVPQVRLGGLERVVPVAVAEGEEVGVTDELFTEAGEGAGEVVADRGGVVGEGEGGVVVGKGDLAVEEGGVGGVMEVVGGGKDGPDGDVAVAVRRLDVLKRRVHVPLGPVAAAVVLVGEDVGEEVGGGIGLAAGEQPLEGPLAGVADAPGRARILLEPVGRGEVDRGIVLKPGEGVGQGGDRPEGGVGEGGGGGGLLICRGGSAVGVRVEVTGEGEGELGGRVGAGGDQGVAVAGLAAGEEQFVAAEGFDGGRVAEGPCEGGVGVGTGEEGVGVGGQGGGGGVGIDGGAAGVFVLPVAQGEVGGEEEAERAAPGDGEGVADRRSFYF